MTDTPSVHNRWVRQEKQFNKAVKAFNALTLSSKRVTRMLDELCVALRTPVAQIVSEGIDRK